MKKILSLGFAVLALLSVSASAATLNSVQVNKSYTASGFSGCTVTGATVATPSVITCAAAHRLVDGDPIQITGIGGTTTDNTVGFAKVTGQSATTFAFYQDQGLQTGVTGTGAYTSGGAVSFAYDISAMSGDWTIRFRIESLTAAKKVLVSFEQSSDGFVADIQQIGVYSALGALGTGNGNTSEYTIRSYQVPSAKFGVTSERIRLKIQSIDGSATAVTSFFIEN